MTDLIEKVDEVLFEHIDIETDDDGFKTILTKEAAKAAIQTVLREMMEHDFDSENMKNVARLTVRTFAGQHGIQLGEGE